MKKINTFSREQAYSKLLDSGPIRGATEDQRMADYNERSIAFGKANNSWFTIRRYAKDGKSATDAQWRAWISWRKNNGLPVDFIINYGVYQVPSEWPEGFDGSAQASDRYFRFPIEQKVSGDDRDRVKTGFGNLLKRMGVRRRSNNRIQRSPQEILNDALAASKNLPPAPLSESTLAAMGMIKREV